MEAVNNEKIDFYKREAWALGLCHLLSDALVQLFPRLRERA